MVARTPLSAVIANATERAFAGEEDSRRDRLIQATAQLVSQQGIAGVSARSVAAAVSAAPSAVNYNFGGMEQLLSLTFAHGAAQTAAWLEARGREIQALPPTPDGAAQALVHVLTEWTTGARPLALLYQESLAAGAGTGPAADWTRLWREFWLAAAPTFGLEAIEGRLLHVFFECEALYHLSTWSPALERSALVETTDHFAATWLGAPRRAERGALVLAERSAGARTGGPAPPAALRIAEAAAKVVEERGLSGLTHRAVATQAGVTTGSVTHHFRSIEDLVAGAIRGQVQALGQETVAQGRFPPPETDDDLTPERLFEVIRFHAIADRAANSVVRRRRLFLAAIRRPDLAGAGAVIRYSHGGNLRHTLNRLFVLTPSEMVLYSSGMSRLLSAIWFACAADEAPLRSRETLMDLIQARFIGGLTRAKPPAAP
jgi:AcrR family transcriptional regulator